MFMKKIEIYLTNDEHTKLLSKIQEFQKKIMDNQDDGVYSETERAEIIDASGSIPFYMKKGLKKQLNEMAQYVEDKTLKKHPEKSDVLKEKIPKKQDSFEKKVESNLVKPLQCEAESEEAADFDFNV